MWSQHGLRAGVQEAGVTVRWGRDSTGVLRGDQVRDATKGAPLAHAHVFSTEGNRAPEDTHRQVSRAGPLWPGVSSFSTRGAQGLETQS